MLHVLQFLLPDRFRNHELPLLHDIDILRVVALLEQILMPLYLHYRPLRMQLRQRLISAPTQLLQPLHQDDLLLLLLLLDSLLD